MYFSENYPTLCLLSNAIVCAIKVSQQPELLLISVASFVNQPLVTNMPLKINFSNWFCENVWLHAV